MYLFSNSADTIYNTYDHFRAVVHHDGLVHWEPGGVFKTMCEVDITYYPFDEQKCKLVFGAWTYHTGKMNLTTIGHEINRDSYRVCTKYMFSQSLEERADFSEVKVPLINLSLTIQVQANICYKPNEIFCQIHCGQYHKIHTQKYNPGNNLN